MSTKNIVIAFAVALLVSVGLATSAHSAGPTARAIGGLTPEEYWGQKLGLHEWLMSELPDGTLDAPIRVPLTKSDQRAIANDMASFPRPLRVGIVKQVGRKVKLWRGGQGSRASSRLQHGVMRETDDGGFAWAVALESEAR